MRFDDASLRQLGASEEAIAKLHQRQRGAVAGTAGYEYQRRYALLRLLECARSSGGTVVMDALCPVDDVVVETPGPEHEHAQAKLADDETWTADAAKLQEEFVEQHRLLRLAKTTFRLTLVTPHARRAARLRQTMHWGLRASTRVRHFEEPEVATQPWTVPEVATALNELLVPQLTGPSQREQLYAELSHICGTPWHQPVDAIQALQRAALERRHLPVRAPRQMRVTAQQWQRAQQSLRTIPSLDVLIEDGICFYSYGGLEHRFIAAVDDDAFERFVERVLQHPPQTMDDLLMEIP